jgi:hypothetical protein
MPSFENPIGSLKLKPSTGYTFSGSGISGSLSNVLSNIIGFITLIAGLAFIIYFMIGSISWITSAGDTNKSQKARSTLTNALIGLAITVLAYPIASVLGSIFGVSFTSPAKLINSLIF